MNQIFNSTGVRWCVKMGFTREKRLETSYPVVNLDIDTLVTSNSCWDDDQGLTSFKTQAGSSVQEEIVGCYRWSKRCPYWIQPIITPNNLLMFLAAAGIKTALTR